MTSSETVLAGGGCPSRAQQGHFLCRSISLETTSPPPPTPASICSAGNLQGQGPDRRARPPSPPLRPPWPVCHSHTPEPMSVTTILFLGLSWLCRWLPLTDARRTQARWPRWQMPGDTLPTTLAAGGASGRCPPTGMHAAVNTGLAGLAAVPLPQGWPPPGINLAPGSRPGDPHGWGHS